MRYEAILEATRMKPADKVYMMGDNDASPTLAGPLHFQPMGMPETNAWLVYRRGPDGTPRAHKIIDGDKIAMIDPSNEHPLVTATKPS